MFTDATSSSEDESINQGAKKDSCPSTSKGGNCSRTRESRTKFRREHLWKRRKAQVARNLGKEYIDRKGNLHGARSLKDYQHDCRFKCNINVSQTKRQEIFDEYWKLGEYNLQTSFIFSSTSLKDPDRVKKGDKVKERKVSVEYRLGGERVCKEFFCITLGESRKRIDNVVAKNIKSGNTGVSPKDRRGKKNPGNKITQDRISLIKEHINRFPRYVSHYTRVRHPTQKFLCSRLNTKKLYELYKDFCVERNAEPVTESFYRYIFTHHFNIRFKKPHSDTCATCDRLDNLIRNGHGNINTLTFEKELHIRRAEAARQAKIDAVERFKVDETTVVICFDLQKTLPTPNLTCSKVFYCRQLWTYNFCVHNLKGNSASMYMWHEGQASRGCQEVASCLLKYIQSLPSTVKHLVAFSDNCGGQNKSALIVRFWAYVVANTQIESIDHRFFIPGHSFMECDQDFSVIENHKKMCENSVFVPEHWRTVVAKASRRFLVVEMQSGDFISLHSLDKLKSKVEGIQKMMWLRLEKSDPFTLLFKNTSQDMVDFTKKDLRVAKKCVGRHMKNTFPKLQPSLITKPIKLAKYNDLQKLLDYVPPIHHTFYNTLQVERHPIRSKGKSTGSKIHSRHPDENETSESSDLDTMLFTDSEKE